MINDSDFEEWMNCLDLNRAPSEYVSVSVPLFLWLKKSRLRRHPKKWSALISFIVIFIMFHVFLFSTMQMFATKFNCSGLISRQNVSLRQQSNISLKSHGVKFGFKVKFIRYSLVERHFIYKTCFFTVVYKQNKYGPTYTKSRHALQRKGFKH